MYSYYIKVSNNVFTVKKSTSSLSHFGSPFIQTAAFLDYSTLKK